MQKGSILLKGVVSKDHVHMHKEYRPSQEISSLVKKIEGRSSRRLSGDTLREANTTEVNELKQFVEPVAELSLKNLKVAENLDILTYHIDNGNSIEEKFKNY